MRVPLSAPTPVTFAASVGISAARCSRVTCPCASANSRATVTRGLCWSANCSACPTVREGAFGGTTGAVTPLGSCWTGGAEGAVTCEPGNVTPGAGAANGTEGADGNDVADADGGVPLLVATGVDVCAPAGIETATTAAKKVAATVRIRRPPRVIPRVAVALPCDAPTDTPLARQTRSRSPTQSALQ